MDRFWSVRVGGRGVWIGVNCPIRGIAIQGEDEDVV
jgi:hypothetical protein